ncbi:MAG: GHKL domain-containing protein [Deltaproteobacteria bacterium]|nr:GHKL domain-containing protein [Deltaproteobacteria bacterium]
MNSGRATKLLSLSVSIPIILAGAIILSILFYSYWQRLNREVERILREQFNQQQLMLAKKISDNVEAYIDFLENAMSGYAGLFATSPPEGPEISVALSERFGRHKHFGVLELRLYDPQGVLKSALSQQEAAAPAPGSLTLPSPYLEWARNPEKKGQLFLTKDFVYPNHPWQGRRVMRFITPLYWGGPEPGRFAGALELLINPFFIANMVTEDVKSGKTGYAWIIDQDGVFLAHYEKDFVGEDALQVRITRNPQIVFRGLRELQARLLQGQEGIGEYDSGWHRQKLGQMPKLAAYTPIRFNTGLVLGVTEVEEGNLWGVCVVAPVEEVSGTVAEVLHQELFLVGLFFGVILLAGGGLTLAALLWNRTLNREIDKKTRELLESQARLVHSERFAAVGEAAAFVSHEIKNPLMVIGGLARQVERCLAAEPGAQEKLNIIQTEVKRLENFLGDLRDFTRPVQPQFQEIDLNKVILEVEALMKEAAQEKGVNLIDHLATHVPAVEADPNQMKQVLVNLIKNAIEASEPHGRIYLSSGFKEGQVWFAVGDMGKGMSDEVLGKIFHPFFTTKARGTGLGLAVIHKIVTDHHGSITVESASGKGSTFTIKLPVA